MQPTDVLQCYLKLDISSVGDDWNVIRDKYTYISVNSTKVAA